MTDDSRMRLTDEHGEEISAQDGSTAENEDKEIRAIRIAAALVIAGLVIFSLEMIDSLKVMDMERVCRILNGLFLICFAMLGAVVLMVVGFGVWKIARPVRRKIRKSSHPEKTEETRNSGQTSMNML